jgi:hypothetical protein
MPFDPRAEQDPDIQKLVRQHLAWGLLRSLTFVVLGAGGVLCYLGASVDNLLWFLLGLGASLTSTVVINRRRAMIDAKIRGLMDRRGYWHVPPSATVGDIAHAPPIEGR